MYSFPQILKQTPRQYVQIIQSLSTSTIFIKEEKINFKFKNELQFLVKLSTFNIVKTESLETEITFPKIGHRLTTNKTHIDEAI